MSSSLALLLQSLFVTTPLGIKHGWLCGKEFDKTMKQSAGYRIELGLFSGRQNIYWHLHN